MYDENTLYKLYGIYNIVYIPYTGREKFFKKKNFGDLIKKNFKKNEILGIL